MNLHKNYPFFNEKFDSREVAENLVHAQEKENSNPVRTEWKLLYEKFCQ